MLLNINGHQFLKNVIPKDNIDKLNQELNKLLREEYIFTKINSKQDFSGKKYYVNNKFKMLNSFQKIQFYRVPVFDIGGNRDTITDKGQVTVYNIDRLLPNLKDYVNENLLQTLIFKLTNIRWELKRVSLRLSNNVSNPMKLHKDDQETCLKCTIYLSDIIPRENGSNIFVEKSHLSEKYKNILKNKKIFQGNKGDLLISFQNGYHSRKPNNNSIIGYLTYYFIPKNKNLINFIEYRKYIRNSLQ